MNHYLNHASLIDIGFNEHGMPIGLLDDIPIEFTHYDTAEEAIEAWERRKERIDERRLYLILFDTIDGEISREIIEEFGKLKCANRIVLSKNTYPDIDYVLTIPTRKRDINHHYMNRNIFGRRRFDGKFDYVKWINDGIPQD